MGRRKYESQVAHATNPELVVRIQSMGGKRTPEIFKIAADYENVVERTPPYHPEVQPMEYIWSRIKGDMERGMELLASWNLCETFAKKLANWTCLIL